MRLFSSFVFRKQFFCVWTLFYLIIKFFIEKKKIRTFISNMTIFFGKKFNLESFKDEKNSVLLQIYWNFYQLIFFFFKPKNWRVQNLKISIFLGEFFPRKIFQVSGFIMILWRIIFFVRNFLAFKFSRISSSDFPKSKSPFSLAKSCLKLEF